MIMSFPFPYQGLVFVELLDHDAHYLCVCGSWSGMIDPKIVIRGKIHDPVFRAEKQVVMVGQDPKIVLVGDKTMEALDRIDHCKGAVHDHMLIPVDIEIGDMALGLEFEINGGIRTVALGKDAVKYHPPQVIKDQLGMIVDEGRRVCVRREEIIPL